MLAGKNLLLVALALGLLAGGAAWAAIRSRDREIRDRWRTAQVLCAKVDVPEGAELEQEMIAVREIPLRFVTASYLVTDVDGVPQGESPVGQRVVAPLKAGDPILASMLSSARETELATLIHPRGRAVSIDVQERSAVGLWVRPNDHVDVIGSFRDPQSQQLRTMTLLQNVVVLATGRITANALSVPDDEKRFSTVTLLTLPEEAEMLTLAQDLGTLTLLLRNPDDLDSQEKRNVVDQKTLFAGERASELQQKRLRTIQIIRGNRSGPAPSAGAP